MNLITFLTLEMHMPTVKAANIITNFQGTSGLTPLVGAFIADAYLGRFKTIAITSLIYNLVMIDFFDDRNMLKHLYGSYQHPGQRVL